MPCATTVILTSGACETRFWSSGLGDGYGDAGERGERVLKSGVLHRDFHVNNEPIWVVMQVKVTFLVSNHNFYLHNSHLAWLLCR